MSTGRILTGVALAASAALVSLIFTAAPARAVEMVAQDGPLQLLRIRNQVYMLDAGGTNVTVLMGPDGFVMVDAPAAELVPAAVKMLKSVMDVPVRYVISTRPDLEHIGGNAALTKYGLPSIRGFAADEETVGGVTISAYDKLYQYVVEDEGPLSEALLTAPYYLKARDFSMNGEGIIERHEVATTDGDTVVLFRHADVLSTGDIFMPGVYPDIDIARGGTVQGLIHSLDQLLKITVPGPFQEGGTYIVPGHGRLCDEAALVEYRNMVFLVAKRVAAMVKEGKSLEQVLESRPTLDYDTEYHGRNGKTAADFITAVYQSLAGK